MSISRVPGIVPIIVFRHSFHLSSTVQAGVQIPQAVRAAVQQKSSDHRRYRYFSIPSLRVH